MKNFLNKNKPILIAEISANHCGNFYLAKKLIHCAKKNNADVVKLQTYTADTMTMKSNNKIFKLQNGLWKNYYLWDLYDKAKTPWSWHKKLFDYGKKINIPVFSTPFDETAVDFLEKLKCPVYKIASFEMTDYPLIKKICKTGKPIIMSTGMSSLSEIKNSYLYAKKNGAKDITLLYCVSSYPAKLNEFHLNNIRILKEKFKCRIGFSDHSKDNRIAVAAVACGAEVIEKHICLDGQKKGFDIKFSLKGKKIKKFKEDISAAYLITKNKYFSRSKSETKNIIYRRSVFAIKNIKKGELFRSDNIKSIRPGYGASPIFYNKIINKKSPISIKSGTPIKYSFIKKYF